MSFANSLPSYKFEGSPPPPYSSGFMPPLQPLSFNSDLPSSKSSFAQRVFSLPSFSSNSSSALTSSAFKATDLSSSLPAKTSATSMGGAIDLSLDLVAAQIPAVSVALAAKSALESGEQMMNTLHSTASTSAVACKGVGELAQHTTNVAGSAIFMSTVTPLLTNPATALPTALCVSILGPDYYRNLSNFSVGTGKEMENLCLDIAKSLSK